MAVGGAGPVTPVHSAHVDTFTRDNLPQREQWPDLVFTLPELAYPRQVNCGTELLDRAVERFGAGRPCIRFGQEIWTYGELHARANQAAHVLVDNYGVVPGNRVLLRGPNNPWLVAAWFATMKAGAVAVTTMPLLRTLELQAIIDKARIDVAICDARFVEHLAAVESEAPIAIYGGDGTDDLVARAREKPDTFDDVATSAED